MNSLAWFCWGLHLTDILTLGAARTHLASSLFIWSPAEGSTVAARRVTDHDKVGSHLQQKLQQTHMETGSRHKGA